MQHQKLMLRKATNICKQPMNQAKILKRRCYTARWILSWESEGRAENFTISLKKYKKFPLHTRNTCVKCLASKTFSMFMLHFILITLISTMFCIVPLPKEYPPLNMLHASI